MSHQGKLSHTQAYAQGRNSRRSDTPKSDCPYSRKSAHGAFWLAGWNDEDIKIGGCDDTRHNA